MARLSGVKLGGIFGGYGRGWGISKEFPSSVDLDPLKRRLCASRF
jgi:hypothetical protein